MLDRIAGSARSGTGFLVPRSQRTATLLATVTAACEKSSHRHVFRFLDALADEQPDHHMGFEVLTAAKADVVEFFGEHTLRAAGVDPDTIDLHLTHLNTPTSTLLHTVWYHDQPDEVQDRLVPLLTEDQAEGTVEVFAGAADLSSDTISLRARLVSTAPPGVATPPFTEDMLRLKLQVLRYLRIANLARHVPATADPVPAPYPPSQLPDGRDSP